MQILRYNVPISLAFEDKNHLSVQREILDFKWELFIYYNK